MSDFSLRLPVTPGPYRYFDAIAVGPGLSRGEGPDRFVETVLEMAELVKAMEDKFGVSAAAPVAVAAAPAGGGEAAEEKTEFDVILVETGGDLRTLAIEKDRFEKQGVRVRTLCAREYMLVFPDFYAYLTYQCASWRYSGKDLPSADDEESLAQMLAKATDKQGRITTPHRTIWVGGDKKA